MGVALCGKLVVFDVSESGKEIGKTICSFKFRNNSQELKQFIMDVDCGKNKNCRYSIHCLVPNIWFLLMLR